ncbi:membrane protein required for colicin V production [Algoriphagus sp. 4150]|uniref:CvpA family protein n=1 Tax=Algoriphagus sp. 4150 TaxID=2817756 RepID=UPI00285631A4|nr:CvpA family protein [Algoriphagus sp. 4150]MDR7132682.1 membrane protein required for colicin V production [Algoriphagus sp. 4150]
MSIIDIIIVAILAMGAFEGFRTGFLLGVLGLFGFVIAIVLGIYFMSPMNDWLAENVTEFNLGFPIFGFIVIFILTLIIIRIVGWLLKQIMDMVLLGPLDATVGAIFGVVKAAFFISLFFWLASLFKLDMPEKWVKDSDMLYFIEPIAPAIVVAIEPYFPSVEGSLKQLEEIVERIKDATLTR